MVTAKKFKSDLYPGLARIQFASQKRILEWAEERIIVHEVIKSTPNVYDKVQEGAIGKRKPAEKMDKNSDEYIHRMIQEQKEGRVQDSLFFFRKREIKIGRIYKTETVNYRTLRPIRYGLFCPIAFGNSETQICRCSESKKNLYLKNYQLPSINRSAQNGVPTTPETYVLMQNPSQYPASCKLRVASHHASYINAMGESLPHQNVPIDSFATHKVTSSRNSTDLVASVTKYPTDSKRNVDGNATKQSIDVRCKSGHGQPLLCNDILRSARRVAMGNQRITSMLWNDQTEYRRAQQHDNDAINAQNNLISRYNSGLVSQQIFYPHYKTTDTATKYVSAGELQRFSPVTYLEDLIRVNRVAKDAKYNHTHSTDEKNLHQDLHHQPGGDGNQRDAEGWGRCEATTNEHRRNPTNLRDKPDEVTEMTYFTPSPTQAKNLVALRIPTPWDQQADLTAIPKPSKRWFPSRLVLIKVAGRTTPIAGRFVTLPRYESCGANAGTAPGQFIIGFRSLLESAKLACTGDKTLRSNGWAMLHPTQPSSCDAVTLRRIALLWLRDCGRYLVKFPASDASRATQQCTDFQPRSVGSKLRRGSVASQLGSPSWFPSCQRAEVVGSWVRCEATYPSCNVRIGPTTGEIARDEEPNSRLVRQVSGCEATKQDVSVGRGKPNASWLGSDDAAALQRLPHRMGDPTHAPDTVLCSSNTPPLTTRKASSHHSIGTSDQRCEATSKLYPFYQAVKKLRQLYQFGYSDTGREGNGSNATGISGNVFEGQRGMYGHWRCPLCGVLFSNTRRLKMGYVNLNFYFTHIWLLKTKPFILSTLFEVKQSVLDRIMYGELCLVSAPNYCLGLGSLWTIEDLKIMRAVIYGLFSDYDIPAPWNKNQITFEDHVYHIQAYGLYKIAKQFFFNKEQKKVFFLLDWQTKHKVSMQRSCFASSTPTDSGWFRNAQPIKFEKTKDFFNKFSLKKSRRTPAQYVKRLRLKQERPRELQWEGRDALCDAASASCDAYAMQSNAMQSNAMGTRWGTQATRRRRTRVGMGDQRIGVAMLRPRWGTQLADAASQVTEYPSQLRSIATCANLTVALDDAKQRTSESSKSDIATSHSTTSARTAMKYRNCVSIAQHHHRVQTNVYFVAAQILRSCARPVGQCCVWANQQNFSTQVANVARVYVMGNPTRRQLRSTQPSDGYFVTGTIRSSPSWSSCDAAYAMGDPTHVGNQVAMLRPLRSTITFPQRATNKPGASFAFSEVADIHPLTHRCRTHYNDAQGRRTHHPGDSLFAQWLNFYCLNRYSSIIYSKCYSECMDEVGNLAEIDQYFPELEQLSKFRYKVKKKWFFGREQNLITFRQYFASWSKQNKIRILYENFHKTYPIEFFLKTDLFYQRQFSYLKKLKFLQRLGMNESIKPTRKFSPLARGKQPYEISFDAIKRYRDTRCSWFQSCDVAGAIHSNVGTKLRSTHRTNISSIETRSTELPTHPQPAHLPLAMVNPMLHTVSGSSRRLSTMRSNPRTSQGVLHRMRSNLHSTTMGTNDELRWGTNASDAEATRIGTNASRPRSDDVARWEVALGFPRPTNSRPTTLRGLRRYGGLLPTSMGMLLRITQPGVDVPSVTSYLPTLGKNSSMLDVLVANEVELQYKATVYANVTDVMANPARTNERYSTKDAANCDGEGYISQRRRPNLLATNYPAWKDPLTPKDLFFRLFPILPPSVRPILKLENEETTLTSDLNTFYHFMMKHASRLRDFVPNHRTVPRDIFREELFLVQRFIDVTYDNGTKHFMKHVLYPQDRPFKSLADLLKKKEGFFRKHLLGKRVDYSGRSVITVGPHLKLHECGIPFSIALELFLPFLTNFLVSIKWVKGLFEAKKYLEKAPQIIIWFLLGKKINGHPVLLNRAPTLHKLGIQAFFPVLHGGKAIELHPLVCGGFNADFDGDQMGVHLPICRQAQMEARVLCLSSENWLSPANGQLNLIPSQDMVLGFYLLTSQSSSQFAPFFFKNVKTILQEHAKNRLPFHQSLWFRWNKAWKTNYKPATLIQRKPYLVRYINNTQVDVMEKMRGNYFVTWHKLRRWGPTHPSRKQHRKEHPVDSTNVVQCDGKDLHDDAKQRDDVELRVASHHASRRSEHRNSRTQPTRRQQQHIPSCIDELGAVVDAELSQYSGVAMLPSWMQNNRSTDGYEMSRLSRHRNIHPTNATVRQGCTSLRKILRNQVTDIGGKDYTPQSDAKATSHYAKQRALVPHDCSVSGSHRRSDLTQYRATQPHHSIQLNDAPVTIDPNMDPDTDPDWFERHRTHMVRLSSCDDAKQRLGPDAEQPRWFPIVRSTQRLVQRNTDVETGYWRRDSEPISTSEVQDCASKTQHTLDAKNANVAVGFDDARWFPSCQRLTHRATTKAPDPTSHTPVPVTQYEVKVATLQSIDVRNNNGIEATGLGWGRCEATTNEHRRTNIAIELKLKLNHRYWIKRIFEKRKSSTNITAYGRPKRSVLANWYVGTLVDSLGTFGRVDVAQWEGRVGEPILTNRLPIAHNGTVPIKHRMGTSCLSMGRCVGNLLRLNSKDVDGKDYITHRRPQQVRRELRVASHHASTQHCNLTQVRNNQCYSDDAKQQLGSADATLPYTDAAYAANLATTDGPTNGEPNCDDAKHPRSRQRPRNTNYHIAGAKQFQSRSLQSRTSLRLQPDDPPLDELYPSTGLTYVVAHFINLDRKRNTIFFKTFQSFYPSFTTTRYAKIKTQYLLTTPGRILFQTYLF